MKKLIFFLLILVFASCTDQEIIKQKPSSSGDMAENAKTLSVQSEVCDYKSWNNLMTGPASVPYNTPIPTTLSNIQGQPGYKVKSYNITVNFKNNSSNLLQLYYNGVAQGWFLAGSTKTISFTYSCTCATGLCPRFVSIPYTWTVEKISGGGGNPYSQIIMTTTVASPHVLNSGSATVVFN